MEQEIENTNAVVLTKEQEALVKKVKSDILLTNREELALFDLPVGVRKEVLLLYIKNNVISAEERKEILLAYIKGNCLCDAAELKIFDLSQEERDEILSAYVAEDGLDIFGDKARTLFDQLPEEEQEKILGE